MGARDLLAELAAAGLSVTAQDDRLVVRPASKLDDSKRAAIREAKAELLALLVRGAPIHRESATPGSDTASIAGQWDDRVIARFSQRRDRFIAWGYSAADAERHADILARRDAEGDDRRTCLECTHLSARGRCIAASAGRIKGADRRLEPVPTILQRCEAFRSQAQR